MLTFVVRRLLQLIPILIGVTLFTFLILNLLPGNVALAILGDEATPSSIRILDHQLGLNQPLIVRYWDWLVNAVQGHLGSDLLDHQPVSSIIASRAPVDFELGLLAILLALIFAIPTALAASRRPGGLVDRVSSVFSMMAVSVPNFVLALVLVLIFAVRLHLVNPTGYTALSESFGGNIKSLALPAISMAALPYGLYVQVLKSDLVQQMSVSSYVDTARMKGASEWRTVARHALPNGMLNLVTVIALNLGTIVGASVLIQQIFGVPGMGQSLVTAIDARNTPVVQGIVAVLAVLVVVANLLADLLYMAFDPRLRRAH